MKGLLSTGASRAWVGVALAGLVIIALVLGLALFPRLGAGQRVIDAATPAFADARIDGTKAGMNTISQYVDVVDPLLTRRGGGLRDAEALIVLMRRKLGVSTEQVRKILRREAPHTEALTRALPLAAIADEVTPLTVYLATILGTTAEEVGALLERDFPRISQSLTALRNTADAWSDVPGIDGLARLSGGKPVRTVPGLRKYYRDDLVPLLERDKQEFRNLAGTGGVGYIPYLLLVLGVAVLAMGLLQARRAKKITPGKLSWSLVVGHRGVRRRARPRRAVLPALRRRAADHDRLQAGVHAGARARGDQRRRLAARGGRLRRADHDRRRRRGGRGAAPVSLHRPAHRPLDRRRARRPAPARAADERAAQRAAADRRRRRAARPDALPAPRAAPGSRRSRRDAAPAHARARPGARGAAARDRAVGRDPLDRRHDRASTG